MLRRGKLALAKVAGTPETFRKLPGTGDNFSPCCNVVLTFCCAKVPIPKEETELSEATATVTDSADDSSFRFALKGIFAISPEPGSRATNWISPEADIKL
mmetsp:Transcript_57299/g.65332  ORF Transcript_57299/g.65332 Transcript_57299/m.65332 type:complete len:100 (+) Transcript_57299:16-315(+)